MAEKVYDLDINSEAFNAFKLDFNAILKALLHAMSKNGAENGEIAVSLKVNIEEKDVIDRGYQRAANVPSFDHKITSKMQFKNEKKGSLSGNFELVYDEEKNEWCIKEIRSVLTPARSLTSNAQSPMMTSRSKDLTGLCLAFRRTPTTSTRATSQKMTCLTDAQS